MMKLLVFFHFHYISTIVLIFKYSSTPVVASYENSEQMDAPWGGKWFPYAPGEKDNNPIVQGNMMGMVNPSCDDGKTNLDVDWNGLPSAYTCYQPKYLFMPNPSVNPELQCVHVPPAFSALHVCMNSTIEYPSRYIPTFGAHRSVWPRYGEYKYVPMQRWLHNLEHGAIVMLYHPCAAVTETERLKQLVRSCLRRHIISAESSLSPSRPLALLAWGCRLEMSVVHEGTVRTFIKDHGLQGPEQISKDGVYDMGLVQPAAVISDENDSELCPEVNQQTM